MNGSAARQIHRAACFKVNCLLFLILACVLLLEVFLRVAGAQTVNTPPFAGANPSNTVVTLPGMASLRGYASDDGLPNPPGKVTVSWNTVLGPGEVFFGDSTQPETVASFAKAADAR